jgi:hypothetical protein
MRVKNVPRAENYDKVFSPNSCEVHMRVFI